GAGTVQVYRLGDLGLGRRLGQRGPALAGLVLGADRHRPAGALLGPDAERAGRGEPVRVGQVDVDHHRDAEDGEDRHRVEFGERYRDGLVAGVDLAGEPAGDAPAVLVGPAQADRRALRFGVLALVPEDDLRLELDPSG